MLSLIYACDEKNGIAKDGKIPWKSKEDMKFFRKKTTGGIVIMGRRTWESLPPAHRPLKNRTNIILSKTLQAGGYFDYANNADVKVFSNIGDVVAYLSIVDESKEQFIIGGAQVYSKFLNIDMVGDIYKTVISGDYKCDLTLDISLAEWYCNEQVVKPGVTFSHYVRT